jgi:uncharacterized protein
MKTYITIFLLVVLCNCIKAQSVIEDKYNTLKFKEADNYLKGKGVVKDQVRGFNLFKECALQGNAKAMNVVGILKNEGIGTTIDKAEALQYFKLSGENGYAQGWYNIALQYKDAKGKDQDFYKAYIYFEKAAKLDDAQSNYALGYFHYKGFGCNQDYSEAVKYFKMGAYDGRSNSMYFLGLCFRNGYGLSLNIDSARNWLLKSASKKYSLAVDELKSITAENNNKNAQEASESLQNRIIQIKDVNKTNDYQKINQNLELGFIKGQFNGTIIKYDWSNKFAIEHGNLAMKIDYVDNMLVGEWIENDSIIVPFKAFITPLSIAFVNTSYSKTDHYSPSEPVDYDFGNAKLQWIKKEDSIYLIGTVQMFSPKRNEPQKPITIVLSKKIEVTNTSLIKLTNEDGSDLIFRNSLRAYPNPFSDIINVSFELKEKATVVTELYNVNGKLLFAKPAVKLESGFYNMPLQVRSIVSGSYLLRVIVNGKASTVNAIKL